jgi:hypothetical protein
MHALLIAGLFVLGAACGATIRLMVFIGVLLGSAVIAAAAAGVAAGASQAGWAALVTIITLQIGYVAGFALRAGWRAARNRAATRPKREERAAPPLGGERRP